jgi:FixJ family two-component response regulator
VNGPALIQRLRRDGYDLPVILMSAVYADVDLPGVRFIAKPFNLDHVLSVVERVLADGIG